MTALKHLMASKADKLDFITEQAKISIDKDTPADQIPDILFRIVVNKVREFLTDKRLESNFRRNADDMDIGGVEGKDDEDVGNDQGYYNDDGWYCQDCEDGDINSFGKGYKGYSYGKAAKGKGKDGKGKGKGKDGKGDGKDPL